MLPPHLRCVTDALSSGSVALFEKRSPEGDTPFVAKRHHCGPESGADRLGESRGTALHIARRALPHLPGSAAVARSSVVPLSRPSDGLLVRLTLVVELLAGLTFSTTCGTRMRLGIYSSQVADH